MYRIGGHVSIAKSFLLSLERIKNIGGNCMQVFATSPRSWRTPRISDEEIALFVKQKQHQNITPVYFHASYLINLAEDGIIGKQSKKSLITELTLAKKLGIVGSIVHVGSHRTFRNPYEATKSTTMKTVLTNVADVLEKTPSETAFIIENAAGMKIGHTLEEIGFIIHALKDKRIKVCLDTSHLFAAGFLLDTDDKLNAFLELLDATIGIERLELFHVNNNVYPLGSHRDQHANIDEGKIPLTQFRILLTNKRTKKYPFILETPGSKKSGPDKRNVTILRTLIKKG